MKLAKRLLILICMLLLLVGGAIYFVAYTEAGLNWSLRTALRLAAPEIRFERVEGRLLGPWKLYGLQIRQRGLSMTIAHLDLVWQPAKLLDHTLHIEALHVQGVESSIISSSDEPLTLPDFVSPLVVQIDDLMIRELKLTQATAGHVYQIAAVHLGGKLDAQGIHVKRFELSAPTLHLSGHGSIDPHQAYRSNLSLAWEVTLPEYETLTGEGVITGDLSEFNIDHSLTAPAEVQIHVRLRDVLRDPAWEATLATKNTNPNKFHRNWPDMLLRGRVSAAGKRSIIDAQGNLQLKLPHYTFDNDFVIAYADDQLSVRKLTSKQADGTGRLDAKGVITALTQTPKFNLTGSWQSLQWPLKGTALISSKRGQFSFTGDPGEYHAQLEGSLLMPNIPEGEWRISGRGGRKGFIAEELSANTMAGILTGKAEVGWQPDISWSAEVELSEVNPAIFQPMLPGQLNVSARTSGKYTGNKLYTHVSVSKLQGELSQIPVDGELELSSAGTEIKLAKLRIDSGPNRFRASGSVGENWDLGWEINAAALSQLVPAAGGVLRGSGQLMGRRETPTLTATLTGSRLSYPEASASTIELVCAIDSSGERPSVLEFSASDLHYGRFKADQLELRGLGTAADHRIESTLRTLTGTADIQLAGGYQDQQWQARLQRADLGSTNHGNWTLRESSRLQVSPAESGLDETCWRSEQASVCASAQWHGKEDWQAAVRGDKIPFNYIATILPADFSPAGSFSFSTSASKKSGAPLLGTLTASMPAGAFIFSAPPPLNTIRLEHQGAEINAGLDESLLRAEASLRLAEQDGVWGKASLPRKSLPLPWGNPDAASQPLAAELHATSKDVSMLALLIPALENVKGVLGLDMQATGTLEDPRITGIATLSEGSATVPQLGITISDMRARLDSRSDNRLGVEIQARSGEGTLYITGEAQQLLEKKWKARLAARGENIEIAHTPKYYAVASPDLHMQIEGNRIDLNGDIIIPEGNIRLLDLGSAIKVSEDVIFVNGEDAEPPASRWQIYSKVRILLGDAIKFNGFDLIGRLAGDMRLEDEPGKPTTARGELSIHSGTYKTYGQRLEVERGRLLFFGGPVDTPSLDARAVRHVDDVTAGIMLRGPLHAPQATLFSMPGMPDADILSYLWFGRPLNQTTAAEGSQLYGAAGSVGLAGGSFLANQIGLKFGLDEVRIESGRGFGEGALVIRHYLSPKLYISYGVGLFEKINAVLMRYQINRKWSVEAESGTNQSGADLLYILERE